MITVTVDSSTTKVITTIPVAGPITNVPEYHDCQRLVKEDDRKYGPLVAIFANQHLRELLYQNPDDSITLAHDSVPAFRPDTANPQVHQGAAEIYSYDGQYRALGIEPGFNCLYLWQASTTEWRAVVTTVGNDADACLRPPKPPGTRLRVISEMVPGMAEADYPPVARWDWDSVSGQQYISIKCGAAWCEVGREGFQSSRAHTQSDLPHLTRFHATTPMTLNEERRVTAIRGWYDEQRLALPTTVPDSLQVSDIMGTAFPHPMLGKMQDANFDGHWIPSAYVQIAAPPQIYKSKLNLDQGLNEISMCFGSFAACLGRVNRETQPGCERDANGQAWARIISANGNVAYRCVTRRFHPGVPIPGTVRWRWSNDDEKIWIKCPQGCCTVS